MTGLERGRHTLAVLLLFYYDKCYNKFESSACGFHVLTLKSDGGKNELIPKTKMERSIVVHQARRFRSADEHKTTLTYRMCQINMRNM